MALRVVPGDYRIALPPQISIRTLALRFHRHQSVVLLRFIVSSAILLWRSIASGVLKFVPVVTLGALRI